jgi:hypothetical protein
MIAAAMGEVDSTGIANQVARNIGRRTPQSGYQHNPARVRLRADITVRLE